MSLSRRTLLIGLGGAIVGLPYLEGLVRKKTHGRSGPPPFALFYRRANGVQQALFNRKFDQEPERWFPNLPYGAITPAALAAPPAQPQGCALSELAGYASKLAIIRGLRHVVTGTLNGHREGFIQGLTGAGVKYPNGTPDTFVCDPLGESLDNRIARQLTPRSGTSMFLSVGAHHKTGLSFLNALDPSGIPLPRVGEEDLLAVYNRLFLSASGDDAARRLLVERRESVNDLVKADLDRLRKDRRLSASDRQRLDLHTQSIRDTEIALTCTIPPSLETDVTTYQNQYKADPDWGKGNTLRPFGDAVAKLTSLAIACGSTRSVLVSVGEPQDVAPYKDVAGAGGYDFHSISHRQRVDSDSSTIIRGAQILHHEIDKFHLRIFRSILDQLEEKGLLDYGTCVHYADIGSGQHETYGLPYLYVGSANGALKTGIYVHEPDVMVPKFLNTIGSAVGCTTATGDPLDDFNAGNNGQVTGRIASLLA
jgi:Protein of unknown function (DUF1552)